MKDMSAKATIGLLSLAISTFAIGTTEFVIVGLLPTVADDLHISISKAGTLISGYAISIAVGTPVVTVLTGRIPKKALLLILMAVFTLGNAFSAIAGSYELLMISRVVTAVTHGVFMAIGAIVASNLVPETKKGTAISILFTGLTVATIVGVPLGTFIGQHFGWRATFVTITGFGFASLIMNYFAVDKITRHDETPTLRDAGRLIKNPRIMMAFLMTAFGFGGTFALFTYLSPILEQISGYSVGAISILLLIYGVALAIGNIIGGRSANQHPVKALRWIFLIQGVVLLLQMWLLPNHILSVLSVIILGFCAFMMSPGVQAYIVTLAEKLVPSAKDIASALNISAFNIGIAAGSALGGVAVDYLTYLDTAWIGAIMVGLALGLALLSYSLDKKQKLF
ncbi:MFS transporter [Sporolactobacillus laevolacticus]|uniref:Sugar MFS transporter n=1 Tax=Sporolactobacillus laevolacticus DSM 442 TaxID=1395513 RepID=V6J722_9BACL|nr:MFS transporter [Sporolactobacillus laevolacticus]EST12579.1 sugar MFS transporter [Sporolactobacillus laevolacticus DSM 442]